MEGRFHGGAQSLKLSLELVESAERHSLRIAAL